jgi:hypothetical protein
MGKVSTFNITLFKYKYLSMARSLRLSLGNTFYVFFIQLVIKIKFNLYYIDDSHIQALKSIRKGLDEAKEEKTEKVENLEEFLENL